MRESTFLEFFCGGGMARAGLGAGWRCGFANDFDAAKGRAYVANWGADAFRPGDIHRLVAGDLPTADLAWASFPCQDLSLAGAGAGLGGARSSAFFGFRDMIAALGRENRAPRLLVLENVVGLLSSGGGRDFAALCRALAGLGYEFGALTIDAALFSPQSRPRLFIVAVRAGARLADFVSVAPALFASPALVRAQARLDSDLKRRWRWWSLPAPPAMNARLADVIEDDPADTRWHSPEETRKLLALMAAPHREKLRMAMASGAPAVGALYRRTRVEGGVKRQRAEVRFDGLAGCLRTPGGGSSRQFIIVVEGRNVRTRLLSGREAARLMGLPDDYVLPRRYSESCHLLGDGVSVPVVRFLAQNLLSPLLDATAIPAAAE